MLKQLMHKIWNERKQNAWLFLELFVVSLFVWLACDSLTDLVSRQCIPRNLDCDNVYEIRFGKYRDGSTRYDPKLEDHRLVGEAYMQCLNIIKDLPEVEAYAISSGLPAISGGSEGLCTVDSTQRADRSPAKIRVYSFSIYSSDYFRVYGIKDILSGKIAEYKPDTQSGIPNVYITEMAAMELFGTTDCVGQEFFNVYVNRLRYRVSGVIENIQWYLYRGYVPMMFEMSNMPAGADGGILPHRSLSIRLKKGVNAYKFEKRFRNDIMPRLRAGNYYCNYIRAVEDEEGADNELRGIYNIYRQNIILSLFALLCGFMGILGTFWLRASARRREIGIMQSIGATRAAIVKQFVTEAVALSTIAFVLAMPLVLHKLYVSGFAHPMENIPGMNSDYGKYEYFLHNTHLLRFVVTTVASYLLVLTISIVGTTIPTAATVKEQPANALKE